MKRVLIVAYHFPPLAGSSGIQRTLRFVQHLPSFGWEPIVLTAHPRAYERTSPDLDVDVPPGTTVCRAQAWDTARHLSVRGRYLGALARPDRWASWRFDAVRQGLRLIREYRPQALFSTYPIATAHVIAAALQRRTGLPWLADFRDPMAQPGYPEDPVTHAQYKRIEAQTLRKAALSIFTTPGAADEYRKRYPDATQRIRVLENGYDEETFAQASELAAEGPLRPGCFTLLHSGIVYPSERDPTQLLQALQRLHTAGHMRPGQLKVRFRAPVAEDLLHQLAHRLGISAYVEVLPAVPYRQALAEMLRADGLLVMQASNCNQQIPAKLYEYLRSGRPILGLTDPTGDTAHALTAAGVTAVVPLDDAEAIAARLRRLLESGPDTTMLAQADAVIAASRRQRTRELAEWLEATSTGESRGVEPG